MITKRIIIETASIENRIGKYLGILYKAHNLTNKQLDILLRLILKYQEIEKKYSPLKDTDLFNRLLFSADSRKEIRDLLGINDNVFQNYFSALRKKKVIKNNKLVTQYVPPLDDFELVFVFPKPNTDAKTS